MARKPDIQYVGQFYVHGSEARQPELKPTPHRSKTTLPKFLRKQQVEVQVDPVALASILVAAVMLILMVVSTLQYVSSVREYDAMAEHLRTLQDQNARLNHDYYTSDDYDLEYIQSTALALGMVPAEQVQTITIDVTVPEPEPEPTVWDDIRWFFAGLFA